MVDMDILNIFTNKKSDFSIFEKLIFLKALSLENRLSMVQESIPVMDGQFWKKSKIRHFLTSGCLCDVYGLDLT